ncbi:hypothetical protein [Bacillus sp. FJAT-50079]|uniref:hypothetical protein n=1 Tax=Bacillus sp. FJAT-50079 TaxID=2833577 RepID=UPI001BC92F82|nr:hypothetical protein [Bacillus sp. FJAT-50079]MBS4209405.1 hypothetical protein [Bacillus sp. FJAT-50079]
MSRLPFFFIITGMIGFFVFHGASIISLFDWMNHSLRGPDGWFHIHLFVLGWATMLAMGAVYQLINVILQSEIYSKKLGYIHYAVFTIGLSGLLYGFLKAEIFMIASFASLMFIGILIFAWNIFITLIRASLWNAITISAGCSVLYLVLTGVSGLAMGINFVTGTWNLYHENIFAAHIWLGTIGWFGLLITGFSYKMLPMFYLSHHYPVRLQKMIVLIWNFAVLFGAASFLLNGGFAFIWFTLFVITVAIILYNVHLLQIKKYRFKKSPGLGIIWSIYASQALMVFAMIMTIYAFIFPGQMLTAKSISLAGWIYIGGWVSFTILCYASKIIPFLWWSMKYGKQAGKANTPLMADLLDEKKVRAGLAAIAVCIISLLIAFIIDASTLMLISGIAFSTFSILYMGLIGFVFSR